VSAQISDDSIDLVSNYSIAPTADLNQINNSEYEEEERITLPA